MHPPRRLSATALLVLLAAGSAPDARAQHDISKVEPAPVGGAIAVPLPQAQQRRLKKYEIPELVGARQAIGSQLIDGRLPRPLLDLVVESNAIDQRISFFEGGLVAVTLAGAGATIRKKMILPADALKVYLKAVSSPSLAAVRPEDLTPPSKTRHSLLRVYRDDRSFAEWKFDPAGAMPKSLEEQVHPLQDLLRAMSEDRMVTNSVAGYEPAVGDELVGDDRKVWRVQRVIEDGGIVELKCLGQPTMIYVQKKDLYNYFIGKRSAAVP